MDSSKALVPVQSFVPSITGVGNCWDSPDRSVTQYRIEVAFTLDGVDEPNEIYGPDGRKFVNPTKAEIIDVYV